MYLKPSEIYFSQAEINNRFDRRSEYSHYNVGDTLDALAEGRCSISSIPTISVKWSGDRWLTADNRRLWVFRHLEKLGKCNEIYVRETTFIDSRKLNSTNGGRTVRFYTGRYASGRWHGRVRSIDPGEPKSSSSSVNVKSNTLQRNVSFTTSVRSSELYSEVRSPNLSLTSLRISDSPNESPLISNYQGVSSRRVSSNVQMLDPSIIRYTKNSISVTRFFENMKVNLQYSFSPEPITVYHVYGKYWATDGNKRLWSYREAKRVNTNLTIKALVKNEKNEFLEILRNDRPWLSVIEILQSGEDIDVEMEA